MNFSAIIRQVGQVSVVEVTGKLTSLESGALCTSIAKLLKEGRTQIVLNLSGLVIKSGGEMKVVGLTERAEEILKITQLYQVFQEFKDERSALHSFQRDGGKRKTVLEIVRPNKN